MLWDLLRDLSKSASSSASHLQTSASQPYSSFVNHYNSPAHTLCQFVCCFSGIPSACGHYALSTVSNACPSIPYPSLPAEWSHTGHRCLPHRTLQLSGRLEITHFLVKTPLSAIRPSHLHHHDSTTSSRVFQDTVLSISPLSLPSTRQSD